MSPPGFRKTDVAFHDSRDLAKWMTGNQPDGCWWAGLPEAPLARAIDKLPDFDKGHLFGTMEIMRLWLPHHERLHELEEKGFINDIV